MINNELSTTTSLFTADNSSQQTSNELPTLNHYLSLKMEQLPGAKPTQSDNQMDQMNAPNITNPVDSRYSNLTIGSEIEKIVGVPTKHTHSDNMMQKPKYNNEEIQSSHISDLTQRNELPDSNDSFTEPIQKRSTSMLASSDIQQPQQNQLMQNQFNTSDIMMQKTKRFWDG